jgi:2-oxo-3-hexenedioate decarboxylase/2-keto-4-pentenoate hydratase
MMTEPKIEEAAHVLADARLARGRFASLPASLCPPDEASAYRIQAALHTLLSTQGEGGYAGHKIGCTTPVMQAYLNIHNPSAGGVLEREIHQSPATVTTRGTTQLGVECEVAVRLGMDLPPHPNGTPYVRSELAPMVSECLATIEIVENRYVDYGQLDAATLIADDFFGAGLILGEAQTSFDPNDLDQTTATMLIDGSEVGSGRGSDILGHPLEALAWLANSLNARGSLLRAGEVVTLGSLVATNWVEAGSTVTIVNDPLGEVNVRFIGPND